MIQPTGRRALCGILAVTTFFTAVAASGPSKSATPVDGSWLRLDTPNFTFFGQVPAARLGVIAIRLEAYRSALEWLHPGARSSPRETSVYVFKDAASGRGYAAPPAGAGQHLGINPPYDVPNFVVVAAPVDDPPLEILYHAYAHQFLDDNFPRLPLALTEGLAEFYSGFSLGPQGILIGIPRAEHVRRLKAQAVPWPQLFSIDARAPMLADQDGGATFMAESWALAHYLLSGSGENRDRLPVFLDDLRRGGSTDAAVRGAYGWSPDRLQQEVARYVERGHFVPIQVAQGGQAGSLPPPESEPSAMPRMTPAPAPRAAGIPPVRPADPARPISRDEVLAALGDLLAYSETGRAADGEALLQEALRLNPEQARAYAGLGHLRYAQGRFSDAVPFLEKALAIQPDAMSCYLLARSLLRINAAAAAASPAPAADAKSTPPWLARARSLLARSTELQPRFAAPFVTLGATHLLSDGDVTTGIGLLQKARVMLPARMDIAGNLVYLFLRKGDFVQAQAMVDDVLAKGGDAEALRAARQAVATFQEDLAAKQSLVGMRPTAEQQERWRRMQEQEDKLLRDALARAQDPEARAVIEKMLNHDAAGVQTLDYNKAAEVYNEAISLANQRDYARAIALLEDLLPKVADTDLQDRIKKTLDRFRQDAARLQQTVK